MIRNVSRAFMGQPMVEPGAVRNGSMRKPEKLDRLIGMQMLKAKMEEEGETQQAIES